MHAQASPDRAYGAGDWGAVHRCRRFLTRDLDLRSPTWILGRGRHRLASKICASVRTSSVAARSTRPPRSYRVRHRIWELRLPPQERRELCQAPDTRMWLNARKLEDETFSVFAGKHTVGKVECLAFQRTNPRLLNPTTRPSGPPTWNSGR